VSKKRPSFDPVLFPTFVVWVKPAPRKYCGGARTYCGAACALRHVGGAGLLVGSGNHEATLGKLWHNLPRIKRERRGPGGARASTTPVWVRQCDALSAGTPKPALRSIV
jgi:hypothetical protein